MNKKTVKDIDLKDKKVLVRCDFNVPMDENQNITDNRRIVAALPTIKYLLEQMETQNVQKMADIILAEAIDNNYGTPKDDMTVIVCKIVKN